MELDVLKHGWNITLEEARNVQEELRSEVNLEDRGETVSRVAGVDVGFSKENPTVATAAVVVLELGTLEIVEAVCVRDEVRFPYVSGFLSFREIPAVAAAMKQITHSPQLLICDGQGIAHPRRLGLACHLGVLSRVPTIGAAKSRLIGEHVPVPLQKGSWVSLLDGEELIGAVLRTRDSVKPLYVSPGHNISLNTSIMRVMQCVTSYRLPETTRAAHKLATKNEVWRSVYK